MHRTIFPIPEVHLGKCSDSLEFEVGKSTSRLKNARSSDHDALDQKS